MMVIFDATVIIGCDRRRPGLSYAPLEMDYDSNRKERYLKL